MTERSTRIMKFGMGHSSLCVAILGLCAIVSGQDRDFAANQLPDYRAAHQDPQPFTTDFAGRNLPSMTASKSIGKGGPLLLQDSNFFNQISNIGGSVLPERVVHAKGTGAHGVFELTSDMSSVTKAKLFTSVGTSTQIFCRFSTFFGERGSAETLRDVRGISCKFYTDEGNFDLLTLTGQVFPIRDPMLYPSLAHAHKKNPQTNIMDPNMMFDFRSQLPETIFQTLTLFSDGGIPDGFRFIDTAAMNTFKLVNAGGEVMYCRFHLTSNQGTRNLPLNESIVLAATEPDYATKDLYNAIANGNLPSWTLKLQLMTPDDVESFEWNAFDPTMQWIDVPFIEVGTITMTSNPVNHVAEVEMAAFDPAVMLPGIEPTLHDPLMDARTFSYKDSQRHRLGINFELLKINQPKVPVHNSYLRDGQCAVNADGDAPLYFPNSFNGFPVDPAAKESTERVTGRISRSKPTNVDDFGQARLYLSTLDEAALKSLVTNLAFTLSQCVQQVIDNMVKQFNALSPPFGAKVAGAVQTIQQSDDNPSGTK